MTVIGRVVSVNVGRPRTVEWAGRRVRTAIWKAPVSGPVAVRGENLDGDDQADRRVHGGRDKAIYAYAEEDYRWWEATLGAALGPATFGENLTTAGIDLADAVVGERWLAGSATLEVSEPRLPCFKLGIRMGDAGFVERFERAARFGTYLRIAAGGEVRAGDPVVRVCRPAHGLRVGDLIAAHLQPTAELLARVVTTTDVSPGWRHHAERALARALG
jgi:MOSC domain-containing protein YiiM